MEILKAAGRGPGDLIMWLHKNCDCLELIAGSESFLFAHHDRDQADLARSALHQLVSMGFIRREGECYRITSRGVTFARSYDLPDHTG